MNGQTTRRAVLLAAATLPALAIPASAATIGDDAELLARWETYREALHAFNTSGDHYESEDQDPAYLPWKAAWRAMENAPEPTTVAGAAASLRYALHTMEADRDWMEVTLYGSAAERADFYRARIGDASGEGRAVAAAIIALERMEA